MKLFRPLPAVGSAMTRLSPTGLIVLVVVLVLTASTAGAATGAALILGRSNSAGETTRLTNTGRGPALKLDAVRGAPPLAVEGNRHKVSDLNADLLDGLSSGAFRPVLLAGGYYGKSESRVYVVPKGVTDIHFRLQGGGGPGGSSSGGGQGAYLEIVAGVKPGDRLLLQPGAAGYASDSQTNSVDGTAAKVINQTTGRDLVAGGGKRGTGNCSDPGEGGKTDPFQGWRFDTVITARDGKDGETCVDVPNEDTVADGGGQRGAAGSGSGGSPNGSHAEPGYLLAVPMRGDRPYR